MSSHKVRNIFTSGPIPPSFVAECLEKHSTQTSIGAHSLFLGQVRADRIEERTVTAIDYTAYEEMALEKMDGIREDIFRRYNLTCMHVHHSLGRVPAGSISLFVFTSAPHRKVAIDACEAAVEAIKASLPIWGKEIFDDENSRWKLSKP